MFPCAVTLGNYREAYRFSPKAWRLVGMMPSLVKTKGNYKGIANQYNVRSVRLWHDCMANLFKSWSELAKEGLYARCVDRKIHHVVCEVAQWQGDRPELETACCCVKVAQIKIDFLVWYTCLFTCLFTKLVLCCLFDILACLPR